MDSRDYATRVIVYRVQEDGQTGPFVGFGSLLTESIVMVHSPANRLLAAQWGDDLPRMRCQIVRQDAVLTTYDGTVRGINTDLAGPPAAISLDWPLHGGFVPVFQGDENMPAADLAAALEKTLETAAREDPPTPPFPPPPGADVGTGNPIEPSSRPWYCIICPHAVGC